MKLKKVDEYIKCTGDPASTAALCQELEDYMKKGPGVECRTLCDRIIRACNHQLGTGAVGTGHVAELVSLVDLALISYDSTGNPGMQSSPLYMEKILFHIMRKLATQGAYQPCQRLGDLLYKRLDLVTLATQTEDCQVLVRSCFAVLWNGAAGIQADLPESPRGRLGRRLQALRFLALLDKASAASPTNSKVPGYTEDALGEFGKACGKLTEDDASFLVQESQRFFCDLLGADVTSPGLCGWLPLVMLHACRLLCKASLWSQASELVKGAAVWLKETPDPFRHFAGWAVDVHCLLASGEDCAATLTDCARAIRCLPDSFSDQERHVFLQASQLVASAFEINQDKVLRGSSLLALFSFLEEYQELLRKHLSKAKNIQPEHKLLFHQALCSTSCQGFISAYSSLVASQLEDNETLERVLLYCKATAGQMMSESQKFALDNVFIKAASAINSLVYALYNHKHYNQAFSLVEILCHELVKKHKSVMPVDKLNRAFLLAVQSSRRAGHLDRALDWVVLWLRALGDQITEHMAEPVSLWVKTKADAARGGQADTRLRTLRDGFGPHVLEEETLLRLLEEELRAYREVLGDTAQERYNTLCDLLDICHEDSDRTHRRAVYLYEMAQVVCFQDFSEQTECSAVDFTLESLRLLDEEPETAGNADRLSDDKAQASLWLYICTLEKNLHEAVEVDKRLCEAREQQNRCLEPVGTNDMDYEDEQKQQECQLIYEGLRFNLIAESKQCQPLDRALELWKDLLRRKMEPAVRSAKQTVFSVVLMAALYKLIGKPLRALESHQLAAGLARRIGDCSGCVSSLCHSARLLLELGAPELAEAQLEQVERLLSSMDSCAEGVLPLRVLATLLRAELCYSTRQVENGVSHLSEVLKEVGEQRCSKTWYLLRAKALQTASAYLNLNATALPSHLRQRIAEHGLKTPDTTLYEGLKLLCSLVVTLLGNGLYGASVAVDTRFIDQGDNVVLKWQLLAEVLSCSLRMVTVRSYSGAIHEAKVQCLEALKLSTKLHTLSRCAEFLVVKAELELQKGEMELSGMDLEQVTSLLDLCIDFTGNEEKMEVKIKPRKGRPAKKTQSPQAAEDDYSGLLKTRSFHQQPVDTAEDWAQAASPKLQPKRQCWLASLEHKADCSCPCCSDPALGRVCARWAAVQAELANHSPQGVTGRSHKLFLTALSRCRNVIAKVASNLAMLMAAKDKPSLSFLDDLIGRIYMRMTLSGLQVQKAIGMWELLDSGFAFVTSKMSPEMDSVQASLQVTKALAIMLTLASQKNCPAEELFSPVWPWNPLKSNKPRTLPSKKTKDLGLFSKAEDGKKKDKGVSLTAEESKRTKETVVPSVLSKAKMTLPSTKTKSLTCKTPRTVKPKSSKTKSSAVGEQSAFDFDNVIPQVVVRAPSPTVPHTPVQMTLAPASRRRTAKSASKLQFRVYEESTSPADRLRPVPAAPKRSSRSRFKIDFSDESDAETSVPAVVTKKRETGRASARTRTAAASKEKVLAITEKEPQKVRIRASKSTASPPDCPSEESAPPAPRRSRPKKSADRVTKGSSSTEEPEQMRTIKEEEFGMNTSLQELKMECEASARTEERDTDLEVLRRDVWVDPERDGRGDFRRAGPSRTLFPQSSIPASVPDGLTLEYARDLLWSALLSLQHFPPAGLYTKLCGLLALCLGQGDPVTTAMLHSQSLGLTSRHHMTRHLTSRVKKLKKAPGLAEELQSLNLDDASGHTLAHRLTQLEAVFRFPTLDPSAFPQQHCQHFTQQLQKIPPGTTLCLLSVVGMRPGEMGDTILLTRLERGLNPVTVRIPTAQQECPVSAIVQEMDSVQKQQKVVSSVADKAQWWEGRRALDSRVEKLLGKMREMLSCWMGLLLPLSSDPEVSHQAKDLHQTLTECGAHITEELLKVVLSAAPLLSQHDIQALVGGLSSQKPEQTLSRLQAAVSALRDRAEPRGHVVLILDKYLQKLPWESISCLRSCSVTRMPSLQFLIGHSVSKEMDADSLLNRGVDPKKVFYVLNPDANLTDSEGRFREWFAEEPGWEGVCGAAPNPVQLQEAMTTKDLYIYVGHGAGARFLEGQRILKEELRAASFLFGCSSAALAVHGELEGSGIILNYLMAGCPLILGNLWDVTDRDIDRFTRALLQSWLSAGRGAALLDHMTSSRQATHLKHLIGAAPVVYGLPIFLR
ncbi:separin [Brienomyrus brachyistius]|uniref:separin n=1 Tax=Brienomyrus brachyistius TaxID=42636 RepID=UPI0020B3F2CB|nr:separin [Brienomyrus brachyistius]